MNENSIFHYYPIIKIPLKNGINLDCRLSICFPDIQPPNICPLFDDKMINKVNVDLVENKPEAPWIKRNNSTIVFTDNLFQID